MVKKGALEVDLVRDAGRGEGRNARGWRAPAKDLPVIVLDHPTLTALGDYLGRPLDGIIGFTFFARYKTTIDYQKNEMTFEPVDFEVKDLMKDLPTKLAGPKVSAKRVLSPGGIIGMAVGEPGEGPSGVPIISVLADSPAAAAGLKPGDVLTTLDGRWTTSVADAYAAAESLTPGKATEVVVVAPEPRCR